MSKPIVIVDVPGIQNSFLRRLWIPLIVILMMVGAVIVWPIELVIRLSSMVFMSLAESFDDLIGYAISMWKMCKLCWDGRK